jgi:ligand-binding sensor domain-containing protein
MKYIISLIFTILFTLNLSAQQFSNWQNYTDMKITKDLVASNGVLWTATEGGGFLYNPEKNSFQTFSKAHGLNGISLTSVGVDKYNKVWFGSADGVIDVYDPSSNSFYSVMDISNSDKASKKINNITISGDTVYVATDFGVSLIDAISYSFLDTFLKFGTFSSNIKVNSVLVKDLIYIASESGVAIQKPGSVNLSAPESWDVYNQTNGLPTKSINKLIFYKDSLFAATSSGVSKFNGTNWENFLSYISIPIIDIVANNDSLYILTPTSLDIYDGNSISRSISLQNKVSKISVSNDLGIYLATDNGLLKDSIYIYPNGPEANQFTNMVVDNNGTLWSASGTDVSGKGFYSYDGSKWTNYNTSNYPELQRNTYYQIFSTNDNTIYAGSWGLGFMRLKNNTVSIFSPYNTDLIGVPEDTNFVVITGFAEDSKNNLWILNLWPADRNTLSMLTPDSTWYFFKIPSEQNRILQKHFNLAIDQYGTKWYCSQDEARAGLYYFNDKGTYSNINDDVSGYLSTSNGLTNNTVSAIVLDQRGDLWVGTSLGVNIISNLSSVTSSSNPQLKISSSFSVRQQTINAIAVDPLNQKWIGSNEGLFLLSSDGTQLLASLNSKNSPLLSDIIESLAIDPKTGRVYVGTESGLTSFDTPSISPVESFNGLNIYPNPLIIKDGNQLVTIDGLVRNTDIKIMSISGKLIREFSSPGGRVAYWDGKDNDGKIVSTGIYIVIAFDQEGNSVETGKIAVLRD